MVRGEIDEAELRQRIRFELDWDTIGLLFTNCSSPRGPRTSIYGLDCMPREDLRKIGARDRHAAGKIAELPIAMPTRSSLYCSASRTWPAAPASPAQQKLPAEPCSQSCKRRRSLLARCRELTITSRLSKSAKTPAKRSLRV